MAKRVYTTQWNTRNPITQTENWKFISHVGMPSKSIDHTCHYFAAYCHRDTTDTSAVYLPVFLRRLFDHRIPTAASAGACEEQVRLSVRWTSYETLTDAESDNQRRWRAISVVPTTRQRWHGRRRSTSGDQSAKPCTRQTKITHVIQNAAGLYERYVWNARNREMLYILNITQYTEWHYI